MEIIWFEVEEFQNKKIPKWQRSAAISSDGVVFVPSAIAGDEQEVYLCTLFDSTPSLRYLDHIYVPTNWLTEEFPNTTEACKQTELKLRQAMKSNKSE